MELTNKNKNLSMQILRLLEKEKCTVAEANEILNYVNSIVRNNATVQVNEETKKLLS